MNTPCVPSKRARGDVFASTCDIFIAVVVNPYLSSSGYDVDGIPEKFNNAETV